MKTIVEDYPALCRKAAEQIAAVISKNDKACLALSIGEEQAGVYTQLRELLAENSLKLSNCRIFLINEFEQGDTKIYSCIEALEAALEGCGVDEIISPALLPPESYDSLVEASGGIDLALLGLGKNCRIGFNEPATPFASRCHRQKLTNATRREKAPLFGGEEAVPEFGLTMGIKTIVEAREILLFAAGEDKAGAVFSTLYGKTDSYLPSAFLQIPMNVNFYIDTCAKNF